jgi:hypothetical protein
MANENDSWIFKMIADLADSGQHEAAVACLYRNRDNILDDNAFWQAVAAVWIKSGQTRFAPLFRILFSMKRRNRHKLMKKKDRKFWRRLPPKVRAYRAVAPGENVEDVFSYTLDRGALDRLYKGTREIREFVFPKSRVVAYFNRRREHEIIVL